MERIRENLHLIVLGLFFLGLLLTSFGVGLFLFKNSNSSSDDIQIIAATEDTENKTETTEIVVHVDGAVVNPGVYDVPPGSRVTDAVEAAGGLAQDADQTKINLAAKIVDGQKIFVFSKGEQVISQNTNLVSINSASESELDKLPGIGPVTAQKIITARPYSSLEDLLTKKVVSKSVWEKIKDLITY